MIDFFSFTCNRVNEIKGELAQQIRADFEEAFQGPAAKVKVDLFSNISKHEEDQLISILGHYTKMPIVWNGALSIFSMDLPTKIC